MSENEINKGKIYVAYITMLGIPELTYALAYVVDEASVSGVKEVAQHTSSNIGWAKQDIRHVYNLEKFKELFPQGYEMIDLDEIKIHCRVGFDLCVDLAIDEVRKAAGLKDQMPHREEKKEMSERQETVADIIAEMRDEGHTGESSCLEWVGTKMRYYADRLDAAHKRELSKNASKNRADFGQLGDAAKLREALEAIISGYENADLCDMNYGEWCHDPANVCVNVPLCKAIHEARAALAAPPRNCDVGTPEEQEDRFRRYCNSRGTFCGDCPLYNNRRGECRFAWAQLPYTEGGAK